MENTHQHTEEIRSAFAAMKDKGDLVDLLNIAKKHLYGNKAKYLPLRRITYYADPRLAQTRYEIFQISKKSGGVRTIHAPVSGLKTILRCVNFVLQSVFEKHFNSATTGFVPGKSIVDNARRHAGKQFVLNLDLKDFFPSVDLYRVKAVLGLSPFNLKGEKEPLAFLIANLCCQTMEVERYNEQGEMILKSLPVLPQGAPTSPILSNIICYRLDRYLKSVAKRFGATYSRYADDITFSGNYDIYNAEGDFIKEVRRIIKEERFIINEKKVRLQRPWYRQEVTGLIVNKQPNLPRDYVKQVRQWIYLWETYGIVKAEQLFKKDYMAVAANLQKMTPPMTRVLEGKLQYMGMVVGKGHPTYRKLWERFEELAVEHVNASIAGKENYIKQPKISSEYENIPSFTSSLAPRGIGILFDPSTFDDKTTIKQTSKELHTAVPLIIYKPKEHNPQNTSNFLDALDKNLIIKSALHKWDDSNLQEGENAALGRNFDHQKFCEALKNEITLLKKQYKIPKDLDTKIGYFFVQKEYPKNIGWSENKIRIGWNTEEMREWCDKNPGIWPSVSSNISDEGFIFDPPKVFEKLRFNNFSEIIDQFALQIRFRNRDSYENNPKIFFEKIFDNAKYEIDNQIQAGVEFYADVEKFQQGIKYIRSGIDYNISKSKKIKFTCEEKGRDKVELIMTHLNSKIDKTIVTFDEKIKNNGGDTLGNARKRLLGVCDWHIEANFADECFRYPVLTSDKLEEVTPIIMNESNLGVMHIFTFYRPQNKIQ